MLIEAKETILTIKIHGKKCGNCPLLCYDDQEPHWSCVWDGENLTPLNSIGDNALRHSECLHTTMKLYEAGE